MRNKGAFDLEAKNFDWTAVEDELNYKDGYNINIGWYCSDRICINGKGDRIGLYYESYDGTEKKFTFNEIRQASNSFSEFLLSLGLKNEDRICLFMDRIPELYFSFLGILKIGAVAQPLFSAFGEESLYIRLLDAKTRSIITQKKHLAKIRSIRAKLPHLEHIIVVDSDNVNPDMKEISFKPETYTCTENSVIYPTKAESPSVLHYTSGTTGNPKGVQHVHYSLISQYLTTKYVLDLKEDDIFWCNADPGWVTGISYGIIGPWSMGITQCVLNAGFSAETWYQFIEKYHVSVWYSSPTAIRSLMKAGDKVPETYDLSSLRHLASVGEPLNPKAVIWSEKMFGKPFHDTYWQTETGSIMIANLPGMKIKPGSMGKAVPGIKAAILDQETYCPLKPGKTGLIAFESGWPAMMRGYINFKDRYKGKLINEWFISGDKGKLDDDGYFWFMGRDDDIINTAGHLVSPFEVESALIEHPAIAESAVVSKPDEINMEVVKAFVLLKPGFLPCKDLELEIMNFIRKHLSALAMPQEIEFVESLPRTRSGKILRRVLHAKEWNEETGDISTLEND